MRVWSRGSLRAVAQWDQLLFRGPVHSTLYFRGSSLSAFIRGLLAHWTSSLPAVSLSHCVTSGRWLCSSVRSEAAIPAREGCLNDTVTPHSPTFTDYWLPPPLYFPYLLLLMSLLLIHGKVSTDILAFYPTHLKQPSESKEGCHCAQPENDFLL